MTNFSYKNSNCQSKNFGIFVNIENNLNYRIWEKVIERQLKVNA